MVPPNAVGEQASGSVGHRRGQREKIIIIIIIIIIIRGYKNKS
jgi:hypothetical protein